MRRFAKVLLLVVAAASSPAHAETHLEGIGRDSCAEFQQKLGQGYGDVYFTWAQGYLSGINTVAIASNKTGKDLSKLGFEAQKRIISNHCSRNPQDSYALAVQEVFTSLRFVPMSAGDNRSYENAGIETCQRFNRDIKTQYQEDYYFTWAEGHLSGMNLALLAAKIGRDLSAMDVDAQMREIRQYCARNPQKLYANAVQGVFALLERRPTNRSVATDSAPSQAATPSSPSQSNSSSAEDNIAIMIGDGGDKCSEFVQTEQQMGANAAWEQVFLPWTNGYLSGRNFSNVRHQSPAPNLVAIAPDAQARAIRTYCAKSPSDPYQVALDLLYDELLDATKAKPLSPSSPLSMTGYGLQSCTQFAQDVGRWGANEEDGYFQWAMGFMSGINFNDVLLAKGKFTNTRNLGAVSSDALKRQVGDLCRTHPEARYGQAALSVFSALPLNP